MNSKTIAVMVIAALLIGAVVVYAVVEQQSKTTVVIQFAQGCDILNSQHQTEGNVTTTFFGVLGLPGTTFGISYFVENLGPNVATLQSIAVNSTSGLTATVSGITLPITLAALSSIPFSVDFTVTAPETGTATVTITATCT